MGKSRSGGGGDGGRCARLEEALRANLKRRKEQARARRGDGGGGGQERTQGAEASRDGAAPSDPGEGTA